MAKFSNIKIGQNVWSVQYGQGRVDEFVRTDEGCKMFKVNFDNGDFEWYFENGKVNIDDINPTLFWNEFHILSDDEDKKPFDLVGFLRNNLEPREFRRDTNNIELYFLHESNKWRWSCSVLDQSIGAIYFRDRNSNILHCIVDTLNKNKITPQQFKKALRKLGWIR